MRFFPFTLPGETSILEKSLPVPVTWSSPDHHTRVAQGLSQLRPNKLSLGFHILADDLADLIKPQLETLLWFKMSKDN